MGERGPAPKRSEHRRRRNEPDREIRRAVAIPPEIPEADESWHPVAVRWFESLAGSGQSVYYQQSDWAAAFVLAESISRELKPQVVGVTDDGEPVWATKPPSGAALSAWLKGMTALLVTEGDRRRAQVELQSVVGVDPEESAVADLNDFRDSLSG